MGDPSDNQEKRPHLEGDRIVFEDAAAIPAAIKDVEDLGGIELLVRGPAPAGSSLTLQLALGEQLSPSTHRAMVMSANENEIALGFMSPEKVIEELRQLGEAPEAAAEDDEFWMPETDMTSSPGGQVPPDVETGEPSSLEPGPICLFNGALSFESAAAVDASLDELRAHSGMMVEAVGDPPSVGRREVPVSVAGMASGTMHPAMLVVVDEARFGLAFDDVNAVVEDLLALRAEAEADTESWGEETAETHLAAAAQQTPEAPARALKRPGDPDTLLEGKLRNPASPTQLLKLRLGKPPNPKKQEVVSLLELLNALALVRASGLLRVIYADQELELPFRGGVMLCTESDIDDLKRIAMTPDGLYALFTSAQAAPTITRSGYDTRRTAALVLHDVLSQHSTEELEAALDKQLSLYPVTRAKVSYTKLGLELNQKQERFLKLVVTGADSIAQLPRVSGLTRLATFRFIFTALIYELFDLNEDPQYDPDKDPRELFKQECERLLEANPFELLGVHWTEHPKAIRQKRAHRRERFDPSGELGKHAPALAQQVVALIDQAYDQLMTVDGRQAARRALGAMDFAGAAAILLQHSKVATQQGDEVGSEDASQVAQELLALKS